MNDLKKFKVLVTPTSYGTSDISLKTGLENAVGEVIYNNLGRALHEHELIEVIHDVDGLIGGLDEITERVIGSAPRLKVISGYGVGMEKVAIEAATEKGIFVCNTPGTDSASVAELTVGLIISLLRKICELNTLTKAGEWITINTTGLRNKKVGLIGFGAIGKETAKRLQAFDCIILSYDPFIEALECMDYNVKKCDLDTLLHESDIVSLHLPVTLSTRKLVNTSFISKMKKGAVLINTARGELLDNEAVTDALKTGQIGGLAIDAYLKEPPDMDDPIFSFNQVIATPHACAHTDDATNAMGKMALENCLAGLQGKLPDHIVNREVIKIHSVKG